MKAVALAFFICLAFSVNAQGNADTAKVIGKVSHEFRKSGCSPVIILQSVPHVVLIPKNKLPKTFDKHGLLICFNYRRLRTPNPFGCTKGTPAEISNISKKK